jgi:hypothetical protein
MNMMMKKTPLAPAAPRMNSGDYFITTRPHEYAGKEGQHADQKHHAADFH